MRLKCLASFDGQLLFMPNPRDLRADLLAALRKVQHLREENQRLREALAKDLSSAAAAQTETSPRPQQICLPDPTAIAEVVAPTDKPAKIALFRSLFRGRDDVYAVR